MFRNLLLRRARQGKYTPLPGQRAVCAHNRKGVVTDVEVSGGELLFTGHDLHDPETNWQSKDPSPPTQ